MSETLETENQIDDRDVLDYRVHDFAAAANLLGVRDIPEVESYYQSCLASDTVDTVTYEQQLLPIVHAFDLHYIDGIDDRSLHGLSMLLTDIHYKKGRYYNCIYELTEAKRRLKYEGEDIEGLAEYLAEVIHDIEKLIEPLVSTKILANKNLPG